MARRQKNGTGSFYHRKDGLVQYRVYMGIGADGKPLRPSFYGKDEKEAIQAYKDAMSNAANLPVERVTTVSAWADKWLEIYKKNGQKKISYSTYRNHKMYVDNHIKPGLGKLKLDMVRPAHIQQFFNRLPADLSASARRHINITLNGIFKTAIENRLCKENPVRPMSMPKTDPDDIKVFSPEQLKAIVSKATKHPNGLFVLLPLYTGMRVSEMTALLWSSVDIENGEILINAAMKRSEGGGYLPGKTKSENSRIVGIPAKLKTALKKAPMEGLYVLSENGSPLSIHQFEKRYRKFFTDNDIEYLSPHKCRHTYATYLIKGGADLRAVQTLLGHSKVTVTEIYTHVDTKDIKDNVRKLKY